MIAVEVQKIKPGCAATGYDSRGVVVEFASDGQARRRQFTAAHLIDSLRGAGFDAAEVSSPGPDRARLFVTRAWGELSAADVYNVFRETEGVDLSGVSLA